MINFTLKILNYNPSGSYSVEYIPENDKCTTMRLDILVNPLSITDKEQVLNLLKNASPQDYWSREVGSSEVDIALLQSIVNTTHSVNNIQTSTFNNPITGFSTPASQVVAAVPRTVTLDTNVQELRPGSTPEEVSSIDDQVRIRLKLVIQEVLMEMAEATI